MLVAGMENNVDEIIKMGIGKYADELELPIGKCERFYLEDCEVDNQ